MSVFCVNTLFIKESKPFKQILSLFISLSPCVPLYYTSIIDKTENNSAHEGLLSMIIVI
jgi:hypothetical protein